MYNAIQSLNPEFGELADIPGIILTPFMLAVYTLPAIVFHELRLNNLRKKLVKKLSQKGLRSIENIQELT